MNVKKDEDVFKDDSCAFHAQPADTEMCREELFSSSGYGLCGPRIKQRNVAKLDAETIAPVYPHQRLRCSSPMKDRCSSPLRISATARHCPEAASFHGRRRLLS